MQNRKIIIGINSRIVKTIQLNLLGFDFISHKEIMTIDFLDYDWVFLFSWDPQYLENNLLMVSKIPAEKLVYISTTAILSLAIRKQWNNYPNNKFQVEQNIIARGARILRIGIWDESVLKHSVGSVPFTKRDQLIDQLNNYNKQVQQVCTVVQIKRGDITGTKKLLTLTLYRFSTILPSIFFFQAPIELLIKLFVSKSYGYSADSSRFFQDEVIIGFGALGSHYVKQKGINGVVLVSGEKNKILNNDGFRNTFIGKEIIGLSKYWHGVGILKGKLGYMKHVPLFVKRPTPNRFKTIIREAKAIVYRNDAFEINLNQLSTVPVAIVCNRLILAAGPIENSRLLCSLVNAKMKLAFSDHELGAIGTIPTKTALEMKLLNRNAFFLFGSRVLRMKTDKFKFLVEFRPLNENKFISNQEKANYYLDSTKNIISKILTRFSFTQINEAIFNKFRVGLYVKQLGVFIQVLASDSIEVDEVFNLKRTRVSDADYSRIQNKIGEELAGFKPSQQVYTIDGQHIVGGRDLMQNELIANLVLRDRLKIIGSPTIIELNEFHNVEIFREKIR